MQAGDGLEPDSDDKAGHNVNVTHCESTTESVDCCACFQLFAASNVITTQKTDLCDGLKRLLKFFGGLWESGTSFALYSA
jgi:hypothetical protein